MTPDKILHIEDNEDMAKSLSDSAIRYDFEIVHHRGQKEAFEDFRSRPNYFSGIIIDGKGWLSESDKQERDSHVIYAIAEIDSLKKEGSIIPYVVYTGHFDYVFSQVKRVEQELVFNKVDGPEKMLLKLRQLVKAQPVYKLRSKYPKAFGCFGGKYLPISHEGSMVELLGRLEGEKVNGEAFNTMRKLIEALFKRANQISDAEFIPSELKNKQGGFNASACRRYLEGSDVNLNKYDLGTGIIKSKKELLPKHLGVMLRALVDLTNHFSHDNTVPPNSKYLFQGSVLYLIEILDWFKKYIDKNYPNAADSPS